jgi:hypothetical protein
LQIEGLDTSLVRSVRDGWVGACATSTVSTSKVLSDTTRGRSSYDEAGLPWLVVMGA